jgi:hypothetical protein
MPRRTNAATGLLPALSALALLAGCGDPAADTASRTLRPPRPPPLIGPAGGLVPGPNGAMLAVPPQALAAATRLELALPPVGSSPALPPGVVTVGAIYSISPPATAFAIPAQVTIPFDRSQVHGAAGTRLLQAVKPGVEWQDVAGARPRHDTMQGSVLHAAALVVVMPTERLPP